VSWRDQPRDDRGRWKKKGGIVALLSVFAAAAIGFGGGTVGTSVGGAGGGGGTAAGRSASGSQSSGARVRARARSTARVVQRLQGRGLRVTERDVDADDDCATHSYGEVQEFFIQQPCTALYRGLFEVRGGGATAVVAVAWVDMPDAEQSREFQQLVDRHGTGNVTELTKEGARPAPARWTGEHYVSARDEATVVNAQAEPVGRTARAVRLAELAADAAAT
jgi:hypothetical protein